MESLISTTSCSQRHDRLVLMPGWLAIDDHLTDEERLNYKVWGTSYALTTHPVPGNSILAKVKQPDPEQLPDSAVPLEGDLILISPEADKIVILDDDPKQLRLKMTYSLIRSTEVAAVIKQGV